MLKFIQYVCLLFLVCSCSTRNEESVILQNETDMEKKNLGSVLALYPKPMTVVGAVVNGKVNWLVVGQECLLRKPRSRPF